MYAMPELSASRASLVLLREVLRFRQREERRIEGHIRLHILERHARLQALCVDDRPLAQIEVRFAEHQAQVAAYLVGCAARIDDDFARFALEAGDRGIALEV